MVFLQRNRVVIFMHSASAQLRPTDAAVWLALRTDNPNVEIAIKY